MRTGRTHPHLCTVHHFCPTSNLLLIDTTNTTYISVTGLPKEIMCLKSYVIFLPDMFHAFTQSLHKHALPFQQHYSFYPWGNFICFRLLPKAYTNMHCPFNNIIAFIHEGILWAFVVDIDSIHVTANFLMNVSTWFYWNQTTLRNQRTVTSLMWDIAFSKAVSHMSALPEDLFQQEDWNLQVCWARLYSQLLSSVWRHCDPSKICSPPPRLSQLLCRWHSALWSQ